MSDRRDFFKKFVGNVGLLRDEIKGVKNIPLNRLKELPEHIIERIEPVFFTEEEWIIQDSILYVPDNKKAKNKRINLNDIELQALVYFKYGIKLKQIANEIKERTEMPFDEIYKRVTSFFFTLASMRICHPKEVYNIDEIIEANKKIEE
jgi:hypothetical protein